MESASQKTKNSTPMNQDVKADDLAEKNVNDEKTAIPISSGVDVDKTINNQIPSSPTSVKKPIILPNGKIGQDYNYPIEIAVFGKINPESIEIEGLDKIGLKYEASKQSICGLPCTAGDFTLKLLSKEDGWCEGLPSTERVMTLIVNSDPKSLWKDIPTPEDIEYYKPDTVSEFVKPSGFFEILGLSDKGNIVAASRRGRSHGHEGKPRDDDYRISHLKKNDWYVMVVADGAGSAKSSRKGAEIACITALEKLDLYLEKESDDLECLISDYNTAKDNVSAKRLKDRLYSEVIGKAVLESHKQINNEALKVKKPIKDFATTFLVTIAKEFSFGWFVGAFWVGDGGIGILSMDKRTIVILGKADGGEFAGQTRFLTMPRIIPQEIYKRLRFEIVDDFTALVLMTDGVTDPMFESDANLEDFNKWDELWKSLDNAVDFSSKSQKTADDLLSWLDFWSPGNHDDRTISILYKSK